MTSLPQEKDLSTHTAVHTHSVNQAHCDSLTPSLCY